MAIITYNQLNDLCLELCVSRPNYPTTLVDYMLNMYNTGCRPAELFDVTLWQYVAPNIYNLNPLKDNNMRTFNNTTLTSYMEQRIEEQAELYYYTTLRKQRYYSRLWRSISDLWVEDKEVELYLFRYRYVKKLAIDGLSVSDIRARMGWSSNNIALGYINAEIYTK